MKRKTHISDVFPVMLLLIFTLSILSFVIFSAKLYKAVVRQSEDTVDTDIAARYMIEKIRSHDELGNIEISDFNGHTAVKMRKIVKNEPHVTYIYVYDGFLRELYAEEEDIAEYGEDSGTEILELKDMNIESLSDDLLEFKFTDQNDHESEIVVALRSGERYGGEE